MRTAGSNADDDIVRLYRLPVDQFASLHCPDTETREIILTVRIHVRHLGRLATDQGGASLFTPLCDASNDVRRDLDVEAPAGEIIQEKQWLSSLDDDIVHAHRDKVDADGVVTAELLRQFQLGADTIGAGYQNRFFIPACRQRKQPSETAEPGEYFRPRRACNERLYALHQCIAGVDVDSGILVCKRFAGHVCWTCQGGYWSWRETI